MTPCLGQVYILCDLTFLLMIIRIRKCGKMMKEKMKVTAKKCAKQVALTYFPLLDPQDRKRAGAPPCVR